MTAVIVVGCIVVLNLVGVRFAESLPEAAMYSYSAAICGFVAFDTFKTRFLRPEP